MRRALVALSLLLACTAAVGCTSDEIAAPEPASPLAPEVSTLYLTASDSSGRADRDVVIVGHFDGASGAGVTGSFAAVLRYDPALLRFVDHVPVDGGMTALNATVPGELRIAGASADGYADGQLFALRFHTLERDAIRTLGLAVRQLGSTAFRNQLPNVAVRRTLMETAK